MKYEEFVVEKAKRESVNLFAQIPFVDRKASLNRGIQIVLSEEENAILEEVEQRLHSDKQGQDTRLSKYAVLKQGLEFIDRKIALDETVIASIEARQGLIKEYMECMKEVDLKDIEQAMEEVHQDKILEKYQYFVGEL